MWSRVVSKKGRTVLAILLHFQQKNVHIVMTDPFFKGPLPVRSSPATLYSCRRVLSLSPDSEYGSDLLKQATFNRTPSQVTKLALGMSMSPDSAPNEIQSNRVPRRILTNLSSKTENPEALAKHIS